MSDIRVNLAERSYVITIEPDAIKRVGEIIASVRVPTSVLVVTNPVIAGYYAQETLASLDKAGIRVQIIRVPAGERFKTLGTVKKIYDAMLDAGLDRKSAVVALGGGVIGDMAGFAAATYMRGIDFYQVPTTLLSQVDASVGGKTGVDLAQGKNLVGAFHQPRAVIIDTLTLRTLPARELRCGLAEVVKHGIIYDQKFFYTLEKHASDMLARSEETLREAVKRSVEIKRDVVEQDEQENGLRAILNYGHTVGHAIEVLCGYGKYRHGEASSIGMVTEAIVAEKMGIAQAGLACEVARVLSAMKLPVKMDSRIATEDIVRATGHDKKTLGGKLRLALPSKIGECIVADGIEPDIIASAIEAHREWDKQGG